MPKKPLEMFKLFLAFFFQLKLKRGEEEQEELALKYNIFDFIVDRKWVFCISSRPGRARRGLGLGVNLAAIKTLNE